MPCVYSFVAEVPSLWYVYPWEYVEEQLGGEKDLKTGLHSFCYPTLIKPARPLYWEHCKAKKAKRPGKSVGLEKRPARMVFRQIREDPFRSARIKLLSG
ncbi:hypothetical protein AVEN_45464-1 [Araneus ventricosus]|uniref:Uncharacterized protein n=1 Tax=Araneus ventricosus TaxID=182803 RepID=A0A4Y2PU25_ARAVE|nr:hypothetical protein AVEN_45464-1 [Araneus ventricosus]